MLTVNGTVSRAGGFTARFDLELPLDGVTAILGPSGAGKSTLLRAIAGFEPNSRLHIEVASETWQSDGSCRAAHLRSVSSVFQDSRLFRHLDVRGNLEYPLRQPPRDGFRMPFNEVVDRLELAELLEQRPATLSGGQCQRVALGRALLAPARLWLFDEPMSALDAPTRAELAPYLEQLCSEHRLPILYVSHALEEVLQIADRVIVMEAGEVTASSPIANIGATPLGSGLAASVLACTCSQYLDGYDLTELKVGDDRIYLRGRVPDESAPIRLLIHARDISIATGTVENLSLLNRLKARVVGIEDDGAGVCLVYLDCHGQPLLARITQLSAEHLALAPGHDVTALIKTVALATLGDSGSNSGGKMPHDSTGPADD
jgi:molybdate transport system ATP-binding protein